MDASKALLERVAAAAGELSKAERKVALAVTSSPEIVSTETIAALSKRAGVSEPTVCRFCKSLGFEGFPDFKNALSVALLTTRPAAHSEVRQGDSVQDVANKVLDSTVAALNALAVRLDVQGLARAVDLIAQSRRVLVYGGGECQPLAKMAALALISLGLNAESYDSEFALYSALSTFRQGDLVWLLDATGRAHATLQAGHIATSQALSILTCAPQGSELSQAATLNLDLPECASPMEVLSSPTLPVLGTLLTMVLKAVHLRREDGARSVRSRIDSCSPLIFKGADETDGMSEDPGIVSEVLDATTPITPVKWSL
ncbi:MAG TPA: MurR/RpiR family transcriptional regulator [Candidatus Avisuccinivibrio pullicola]|nr:MurR/RpiR family transcriptional regulator [Candidatus Avisuccinivibrio pullicola]